MTNQDFTVTFDNGTNVLDGKVRRFSTSKDGVYCDIERRIA